MQPTHAATPLQQHIGSLQQLTASTECSAVHRPIARSSAALLATRCLFVANLREIHPLPKASVALLLAAGCRARWHRSSAVPTTSPCAAANPFSRLVRLHAALGVAAGYRHCTVCAATGTIYSAARLEIDAQHYALRNVCARARVRVRVRVPVCACVCARARVCAGGTAHPAPCRPVRLRPSAV